MNRATLTFVLLALPAYAFIAAAAEVSPGAGIPRFAARK